MTFQPHAMSFQNLYSPYRCTAVSAVILHQ